MALLLSTQSPLHFLNAALLFTPCLPLKYMQLFDLKNCFCYEQFPCKCLMQILSKTVTNISRSTNTENHRVSSLQSLTMYLFFNTTSLILCDLTHLHTHSQSVCKTRLVPHDKTCIYNRPFKRKQAVKPLLLWHL